MQRLTLAIGTLALLTTLSTHSPAEAANFASLPSTSTSCEGCLTTVPLELDSGGALFFGADLRIGFDPTIVRPTNVLPAAIASDCALDWTVKRGRANELAVALNCPSGRIAAGPVAYAVFDGVAEHGRSALRWLGANVDEAPVDFTLDGSLNLLAGNSTLRMTSLVGAPGATVDLTLEGDFEPGTIGINAEVHWDPAVLSGVRLSLADGLPADCALDAGFPAAGEARIAVSCSTELSGAAPLVNITVDVARTAGSLTALDLVASFVNQRAARREDGIFKAAPTGDAEVSFPTKTYTCEGEPVGVPINVCPSDGVIGMDFKLAYDPAVVLPVAVDLIDLTATDCFINWTIPVAGELSIAISCTSALSGCGDVANITFDTVGAGPATSALTWLQHDLNEGQIPSNATDGEVCVTSPDEFLALPGDAKGTPAATIFVPLTGDLSPGSLGINATLNWDPAVLTALSITADGGLPGDWSIDVDLSTPGTALISLFGTTPISGALTLANIEFLVIGAEGETSDLTISFGAVNEIPVCLRDGAFSINPAPECGDGTVDPGEVCDDGNNDDGDGCSADCQSDETCGNGVVDPGEVCDDGNNDDGDGCSADCQSDETCGNGILDPGEVCDDGNNDPGDGCSADCQSDETCGNGVLDPGEVCDDGNNDDGDGCSADCLSTETCGNGVVDPGEVCDDGNNDPGDGCSPNCLSDETCGNAILDPGEECDDGNTDDGDGCSANCTIEGICGDGVVDPGEACDDGNNVDGDGCSADCVPEGACCSSGALTECFLTTQIDCVTNHILYLGDGSDCSTGLECVPLAVTLDSISATATPEGVLVQWVTAMEIDTVGFRVLRETMDGREKRLESVSEMIVAVGNELAGATYELLDDSAAAARAIHYYLEDVDVYGRTTRHGPFTVDRGVRQSPTQRSGRTR